MSGAMIIGTLLEASAAVTAKVSAIKLGRLPDNTALNALLVRTVSVVERHPLKRAGWVRRTARVAVTVRAKSYRDQTDIIELVNGFCPGRKGDVLATARNVSILPAGIGPDVAGPANSYEQTHDFRVSFDAPVNAAGA